MKLLEIWKAFNSTAKLVIVVLAVVLIGSFLLSFAAENKMSEWRDRYNDFREEAQVTLEWGEGQAELADSALAVADSSKLISDSLTTVIGDKDEEIADMRAERIAVAVTNDSTFEELTGGEANVEVVVADNAPVSEPWIRLSYGLANENMLLNTEIKQLDLQIQNYELRDSTRLTTIVSLESAVFFQKTRADSLQVIVLNIPEPPPQEKIFGLIPLPSRKVSLIVGGVLGVVATVIVTSGGV
jgi:hypothetical protein